VLLVLVCGIDIVIFQNRRMYFHFVASILTRLPRVAVVNSIINSQSESLQSQIQPGIILASHLPFT